MLNVEDLKNMSILNKIIAILRNAFVVKYSQLITLLGNRAEKDNVVSCLKRVAVLVRGCWVINSEILYPEKSVSSACGISADLMRRGRDYILWRIEKHGFVMRKEMCSHTKVRVSKTKMWQIEMKPPCQLFFYYYSNADVSIRG